MGGTRSILWVDKKYAIYQYLGGDIRSVTELKLARFDYVIIAVASKSVVAEIRSELINMGINENIIMWERPILIQ